MYTKKEKELVSYTRNKVRELFANYPAPAHGFDHVVRVTDLVKLIAAKEKVDLFLAELSGWLHDIGRTLETGANLMSGHHELSYELCQKWFKEDEVLRDGLTKQQKLIILYSIRYHWNNAAEKYPEAWVLRDADKIDALGLTGIKRLQKFCAGDMKKVDFGLRLFYDNFYWLKTKAAKDIVKKKGLEQETNRFYINFLRKMIKPVKL